MRRELERVGMDQALMGGIVLCGGGARLNGMCDMAEKVLQLPGAQRPGGRDSGLAGGYRRHGMDHGRRTDDVLGEIDRRGSRPGSAP